LYTSAAITSYINSIIFKNNANYAVCLPLMLIFIAQSRLFGKHYWPVKVQNMFYQAIDTLGKDQ